MDRVRRALRLQALMPSVADIFFIYIFLSIVLGESGSLLGDSDTGWHIRNGQHMLERRSIPTQDIFSYTMGDKPWYAWEWLTDLILGAIHGAWGLNGVVVFSAAVIAFTYTLWFKFILERTSNLALSFLLAVPGLLASTVHWHARPHMFTWLLTLLWYRELEALQDSHINAAEGSQSSSNSAALLTFFCLSMLLWVNLHGGFVVGLTLLALYLAANAFAYVADKDPGIRLQRLKLCRRLLILAAICSLITLINPYGYKLHLHIFGYLTSDFIADHVQEWASPNFHSSAGKLFELLLMLMILAIAFRMRSLSHVHFLLMLAWTHLALYSVRNIPLFVIIVTPIIALHLNELAKRVGTQAAFAEFNRFSADMAEVELKPKAHLLPTLAVLIGIYACANGGRICGLKMIQADFDPKKFPVSAADFIQARKLPGNLFSTDYWGGYLIYRFWPERKVFVDGRSDFYREEFLRQYLDLTEAKWNWEQVLQNYSVDYVLMPVDSPLVGALKGSRNWQTLYDDGFAAIFARGGGAKSGF